MTVALITGVSGQDGSYLAELLLQKGYKVYGMDRRKADASLTNIEGILNRKMFELISGDLLEDNRISHCIKHIKPDEVYHLAAQSFVKESWEVPVYTCNVNAMGTIRMLEAIRTHSPRSKFYHASSSEIFGKVSISPQTEWTYHYPCSPYACSKSFAHNITRNYRESFNMFCCNGICFNHESERRGMEFVTRKITNGVARIKLGFKSPIVLGNLGASRDWGYAPDYVRAMWMMLQHKQPGDYIIATNENRTIREFVEAAFNVIETEVTWMGKGENEKGYDNKGNLVVSVSPQYFRPIDVNYLLGDHTKIMKQLKWKPKIGFEEMVERMVKHDIDRVELSLTPMGE